MSLFIDHPTEREWDGHLLNSREVMTQGPPLATIAYGIWILPLIKKAKSDHTGITQPWYADNTGALGT